MNGQVNNQHYIPRMYIERISNNEGLINVWKLNQNIILRNQNAGNYAAWSDEQSVEEALERCEAETQEVFSEIEKDPKSVCKEENQIKLAKFLHVLAARTEKVRNKIDI